MKGFLSLPRADTAAYAFAEWPVSKTIPCGSSSFLQCLQESRGSQTSQGRFQAQAIKEMCIELSPQAAFKDRHRLSKNIQIQLALMISFF